jgi:hypothetical protein
MTEETPLDRMEAMADQLAENRDHLLALRAKNERMRDACKHLGEAVLQLSALIDQYEQERMRDAD